MSAPSSYGIPRTAVESLTTVDSQHTGGRGPGSRLASFPLRKRSLDYYTMLHAPIGDETSPHLTKRPKVLKTSFDTSRSFEVRDHMHKCMLDLAQMSQEVYAAKMQYQRLRMRELDLMKIVMEGELEETQGHLSRMEVQVGQIHKDLPNTRRAILGSNAEQWGHIIPRLGSRGSACSGSAGSESEYEQSGSE